MSPCVSNKDVTSAKKGFACLVYSWEIPLEARHF